VFTHPAKYRYELHDMQLYMGCDAIGTYACA
jgi:hypothetical protein